MAKKVRFYTILFFCVFAYSCAKGPYKNTYVSAGTFVEVISPDKRAGKIVFQEFQRLDKIFNFYNPQSELAMLNINYNIPFKVSPELIEVLQLARIVSDMTGGSFDVTYGALYNFWKELIKQKKVEQLPPIEQVEEIKRLGGWENVEIDSAQSTILIKQKGLKIDLGGIAVGYMVDKAVQKLKEAGINSALINAGGDIYCLGDKAGQPWTVGIKDPEKKEEIIGSEPLIDEAISTSGNYEQFFEIGGRKYSHIIDPKKGFPVESPVVSVSVITKNCTSADSLGTAFFVMGFKGVTEFLDKNPSTMRIFIVTIDDKGKNLHILK